MSGNVSFKLVAATLVVATAAGAAWWMTTRPRRHTTAPAPAAPVAAQPTVAAPAPAQERGPAVWAVVVGIDRYDDNTIPPCRGAVADAREVARWLGHTAGWGEGHTLLLDDRGEAKFRPEEDPAGDVRATRENLDKAAKWLARKVRPGDVAVFYFAGQAAESANEEGTVRLLPTDARAADPSHTGWSPDEALDGLAASGRGGVVCWLDTSPVGRGRGTAQRAGEASASRWLQRLARWPGTTAWLAATEQPAPEAAAVGRRSPFTAALLEALGKPDQPRNLLGCLGELNRDPALARQGFRALGGVAPELDLWSGRIRRLADAGRQLMLQRAHAAAVSAVTFTPDGARLVTGSRDSTVRVWRVEDRALLRVLSEHLVGVTAMALSPDGRLVVSGDGTGALRVWDLVEQRERDTGPPHPRGVDVVGFLPGGKRFATLDLDGRAWLWPADEPARGVAVLADDCTALACSPAEGTWPLATARSDGSLVWRGPDGKAGKTLAGPGGLVTSRQLATNGRFLAAGDANGHLVVWDREGKAPAFRQAFDSGPVDRVHVTAGGLLVVACGSAVHTLVLEPEPAGPLASAGTDGPVEQVAVSDDGRWLAAQTGSGELHAWRLDERGRPVAVALEGASETGRATALAIASGGRAVVAGDQDGGLRFWGLPRGETLARVRPHRGQVVALGVSDDARHLLQVTRDGVAQVWDLAEGRGPTTLDGRWASGAISPDGGSLALVELEGGDVLIVDRTTGRRRGGPLSRPKTDGAACRFGTPAFSRDAKGRYLAAGSADGPLEGPLVCVWAAADGKLVKTARGHADPHPITAVEFSGDGTRLLSASEDGTARVWDVGGEGSELNGKTFEAKAEGKGRAVPLSSARFGSADGRTIVAGGLDGRVYVFGDKAERPTAVLGPLAGPVRALAVTRDGRFAAAAGGADRSIRVWALGRQPRAVRLDPAPHHTEAVNALLAWPDSRILASASDDTTVRLWGLADRRLLGTLAAEQDGNDWVAYTPDGLFDSSAGGEARVTWLRRGEVLPLDQFYDHAHAFLLSDRLRRGERPEPPAPPASPPPGLALEGPFAADRSKPEAELMLSLAEPGLSDVRLYHNGTPVLDAAGLGLKTDGRRVRFQVHLAPGTNQFYAMASRADSADGRSNVVELRRDGTKEPGRLHVLALGVSRYETEGRSLRFADGDAQRISEFLAAHNVHTAAAPGLRLVLKNDEVSEPAVETKFRALREATTGRPEDTVVVFLAGHTDVLARRFHLLLASYPFPREGSTARSRAPSPAPGPKAALPYVAIYRNLSRLGALQRLVIIDACQAEAIADDPGVRLIRQMVDDGAHRAKTAYLLAARRGEAAGEVPDLEHGLMTYVLLRGMGDPSLRTSAPTADIFRDAPTADRDGDGVVTTDELRWYASLTLPELTARYPLLVQRSGGAPVAPVPTQGLRMQSWVDSFGLVSVPRAK